METLIDTHLHLIDRGRLSYPWLANVPALNADATIADYAAAAARLGIGAALHMEVDVAESDMGRETEMVADAMAGGLVCGAIAAARPELPGFHDWLDRLDRGVVRGLRRVLHVVPDDLSQSALFRENIRALGPACLPFDICMTARQLPLAAALVDAAPDVQFVLDHCGNPDIAGGDTAGWRAGLTDVARRPNVICKVSGLLANTGGPDWRLETLRPYVESVIDCFGWDRVVWGSDSPVCNLGGSLADWVAATRALCAGASADERERFYRTNARRIWGL